MSMTPSTVRRGPQGSTVAVWAPWLAAPLFALLPIGGCGLADGFRPAAAQSPTTAALVDSPAGAATPRVPVVRVVPIAFRGMAPGPAAN